MGNLTADQILQWEGVIGQLIGLGRCHGSCVAQSLLAAAIGRTGEDLIRAHQ